MRRTLITLVTVLAVAALLPTTALAARVKADSFDYVGLVGDIVSGGDTVGVWSEPDGVDDSVFSLKIMPTTTKDLSYLRMTTGAGGFWDTSLNGEWAIGVTSKLKGKVTLLNDLSTTEYTGDLDRGLVVYLHVQGSWYMNAGSTIYLMITYDDGSASSLSTTLPW